MKRKLLICLFLISSIVVNSQVFRPYIGVGAYLHTDFEKSVFMSFKTGGEFKVNRYFKPELEISGIIGSLETRSIVNDNNIMIEEYTRAVSAINFSFCTKIVLGNAKELDSYFVILPRFSISNVEANKKSYLYNNTTGALTSDKKEIVKNWSQSFGIGIGYNFDFSAENSDSMCLILDLQNVDMGKAINELSTKASRVDTKWTLGLGLNYYFNLKRKKS